jgi:DNA-binding response OmpR family regulator
VKRLLIVDDDDAMRRLVRLNLSDSYEIIDTGDPEQALALAMEHKPDAILLDLRMPKMSGIDLCRTLSACSKTQPVPVFLVSGEPAVGSARAVRSESSAPPSMRYGFRFVEKKGPWVLD